MEVATATTARKKDVKAIITSMKMAAAVDIAIKRVKSKKEKG
jgi:hypothetical protein